MALTRSVLLLALALLAAGPAFGQDADPHARPSHKAMKAALIVLFSCYDEEGITECLQPEEVVVASSRCRSSPRAENGEVRVACRITGSVTFGDLIPHRESFSNLCILFKRHSRPGDGPVWSGDHVPDATPCEADR